jgi:hypothetical protein
MTQATVGFLDESGNWVPVTATTGLPTSGGGGGAAVTSVNGETGEVILSAADVGALPSTYTPPDVTVPDGISATGTPSATTYLRGDGSWTTPPNTTYSIISQANAENPASTAAGTVSGQRLAQGVAAYLAANPIPDELPTPPAEGTFNLQSVDGVISWVAV